MENLTLPVTQEQIESRINCINEEIASLTNEKRELSMVNSKINSIFQVGEVIRYSLKSDVKAKIVGFLPSFGKGNFNLSVQRLKKDGELFLHPNEMKFYSSTDAKKYKLND